MSITFSFAEDEQVEETFACCEHGCVHCGGTGTLTFTSGKHEVNMANENAYTLMRVLGITPDYCGSIPGNVLAYKAMHAINRLGHVEKYERSQSVETGPITIIHAGLSAEQICERLARLQSLGVAAGTRLVNWD